MANRSRAQLAAATLVATSLILGAPLSSSGQPGASGREDVESSKPVLVELFTSQGCSSCPPADALLRELADHDDVVALSYHVDYWNRLGWKDPYSKREFTRIQERYARALDLETIFTPQIVIDGVTSLVGSHRTKVLTALERHKAVDKADLQLTVERTADRLSVVTRLPDAVLEYERDLDLVVGVAQNGIETAVSRGENSGRTLRHDSVVRQLVQIDASERETRIELELDETWRDITAFAFLQDQGDRMVMGAAKKRLLIE